MDKESRDWALGMFVSGLGIGGAVTASQVSSLNGVSVAWWIPMAYLLGSAVVFFDAYIKKEGIEFDRKN